MSRRTLAVTALVVTSLVAVGGLAAPAAADDDCEPEHTVTIDDLRQDNETINHFEATGEANLSEDNVAVDVDADEAFVRLHTANPNSYCTEVTVELGEDVVSPATLGSVEAVGDEDIVADWRSVHDFDVEETYTEVTVRLPAETEATFAPSQIRVKALSWTSELEASGVLEELRDRIGWSSPPLEERSHTFEGVQGERVTIPLTHPEDGEEVVDSWLGTYTVDGEQRVLAADSSDPVFYRTVDDGEALEIVFNEDATVEFVAEPTIRDRISYEVSSFLSSLSDAFSWPFSTGPVVIG